MTMIREHPDPLVRDQYAVDLATRCRLDVNLVRTQLEQKTRSDQGGRSGSAGQLHGATRRSRSGLIDEGPELEALKLAVQDRSTLADLVVPELFDDELSAVIYDLLGRHDTLHEVIEAGGPEVAEVVQRLSVEESQATAIDVAARLWEPYLERLMAEWKAALSGAPAEEQADIFREHTWIRLKLEEVRDPSRQAEAIAELLVWIEEPDGEVNS
jgi:hypothetical protein